MGLKKSLFGFFICIIICFIFVSCGAEPVVPGVQIIDISNNEVLDEYVDIGDSTTPSTYKDPGNPLQLPPFSTTLVLTFVESETSTFIVEFLGEQYNKDFGTLELDLTGVGAGIYPLTIITNAKASSRNHQTQIWIEVDNGIELPDVDLSWLEKTNAECSLFWETEDTENATIAVYLRTLEASEGVLKTITELTPNTDNLVELTELEEGQSYQLGLRREGEPETNWLISFKTFKSFEEGLQLFYWLDLTKPETHLVGVKVFGYYKAIPSLTLDNSGYHTDGGMARGSNFNCVSDPDMTLTMQNDNKEAVFDLYGNDEGYFAFSYDSNKEAIETENHGVQGYFGEDYLIASHEQLLYGPANTIDQYLSQNARLNGFDTGLYLKLKAGWNAKTGWQASELNLYQLPETFDHCLSEFFRAANIYAYKASEFKEQTLVYGDSFLNIILSKDLADAYFDDIQLIYEKLMEIWGAEMPIEEYTLILPESPSPDKNIYAGEWSTGQGFSTNWGIIGKMLIHQMYHVWNAWAVGIPWDHSSGFNHAFWNEGFNEYYDDKILTLLNFETTQIEDHQWLQGWYNQYAAIRGTTDDLNLLNADGDLPNGLEYYKGAVYAFALNQEISDRSQGEYNLDDLLKAMWEQYAENGIMASYEKMLEFFDGIIDDGMRDWAEAYLGNNEPLYLYEFEASPPLFKVTNPQPTSRSTDVSQTITLTWEDTDRADYNLNYDVFIGELFATDLPIEAVYTGLSNPSQEVSLKANTQYIWRVKAYDGNGNEYISPVWFFTTGEEESEEPFLNDVTIAEAKAIIQDNEGNENFIIIDVRTPSEYNNGHIENAVNVNYNDNFEANMDAFDRNDTYLVYCGSGTRSSLAVDIMYNDMGFTRIYHMYQGYSSW
jgi:rhodanese-related sulfurtransferase